jgi:chemotaxis protein MotB
MAKHPHHGGAWKVAYADFVTAMMALFMVLWLAAQDQKIKEAVERAFRHPFMSLTKESSGLMPNINKNAGASTQSGKFDTATASAVEVAMLRRLEQDIANSLAKRSEDQVSVELLPEGLRITVFDTAHKPIFQPDSDQLTEYGTWIMTTLAWQISRYDTFCVEIEGHTESGRPALAEEYGSWELSADRANAGRRKLIEHGVKEQQVIKVAGFADTHPMEGHEPADPANRRITLMLKVETEQ